MKIAIKTKNLELTPPMTTYINQKVRALEKFLVGVDKNRQSLVEIEIARKPAQRKGPVYYAEINLEVPGKLLRATENDFNVRVAVNRVRDKIRREIKKYKTSQKIR